MLGAGLGDRGLRLGPRFGFGSRFELDRGAQLVDRRDSGQLRVMLIRSLARPRGDDPDLIQRQPALPHACRAAGKLRQPARHSGDRVGVSRGPAQLPGHQRRHRPCTGGPAELVAIQLGDDLHQAPINGVALPGQLRQLLEQHLNTLSRAHHREDVAVKDMTSSLQPGPTSFGRRPAPRRCRHHLLSGTASLAARRDPRGLQHGHHRLAASPKPKSNRSTRHDYLEPRIVGVLLILDRGMRADFCARSLSNRSDSPHV